MWDKSYNKQKKMPTDNYVARRLRYVNIHAYSALTLNMNYNKKEKLTLMDTAPDRGVGCRIPFI